MPTHAHGGRVIKEENTMTTLEQKSPDIHFKEVRRALDETDNSAAEPKPVSSLKVLVVHLFWMLLGPALLFAILYVNTTEDQSWFSMTDLFYFIMLGLIVLARWADQRSGQCTLTDGQDSTWKDFFRFVYVFIPSAIFLWIATNVIGNYLI
jgi:hypothetical protein